MKVKNWSQIPTINTFSPLHLWVYLSQKRFAYGKDSASNNIKKFLINLEIAQIQIFFFIESYYLSNLKLVNY